MKTDDQAEEVNAVNVINKKNPHSVHDQVLGMAIASVIAFLLAPDGAVWQILAGIFLFADAWEIGIYKKTDSKTFLNLSPMGWGIAMIGLQIITYPAYLLIRKKLRTKDGPVVYWVFTNIFVVINWLLFLLFISSDMNKV